MYYVDTELGPQRGDRVQGCGVSHPDVGVGARPDARTMTDAQWSGSCEVKGSGRDAIDSMAAVLVR